MPSRKRRADKRDKNTSMYDLDVPLVLATNKGTQHTGTKSTSAKKSGSRTNAKAKPTAWRGTDKEQHAIIQRLASDGMGYSTIALSHTVHGIVVPGRDDADIAIPDSILISGRNKDCNDNDNGYGRKSSSSSSSSSKKSKSEDVHVSSRQNGSSSSTNKSPLKIIKRLNIIIEQESDLAHYSYNDYYVHNHHQSNTSSTTKPKPGQQRSIHQLLQCYDLIAFSPRNETVLSAICNSKNLFYVDILTLDYTAGRGGVQLPYVIKKNYIQAASRNGFGLTFELPYGPALLDPNKRKAMVQAARQFQNASLGVLKPKPRLIVSSGGRILDGSGSGRDYGGMVLRSAGDILNLCKVVLGLGVDVNANVNGNGKRNSGDDRIVKKLMGENSMLAVNRGRNRRFGKMYDGSLTFQVSNGSTQMEAEPDMGGSSSSKNDNADITKGLHPEENSNATEHEHEHEEEGGNGNKSEYLELSKMDNKDVHTDANKNPEVMESDVEDGFLRL